MMKKFLNEFKEFAVKGNALEMAVGVIIATAFSAIVNSIVNDILMPIIGMLTGGIDFSGLSLVVGSAELKYGMLIQNIINFLIVAFCLFVVVKVMNGTKRKKELEETDEPEEKKSDETVLLEEIRDVLISIKKDE
jgi:large conductance mechanosensitive channel